MPYNKTDYDIDYAKKHITRKHLAFNDTNPKDVEMLSWLNRQDNVTQYIKDLIRTDMVCQKYLNRTNGI